LCWVEDESNSDESFDRNFIRHRVIPLVRSRWPGVLNTVGRSARHLYHTETLLIEIGQSDYFLKHLEAEECKFKNFGKVNVSEIKNMPLERSANLLRYWVRRIGHEVPNSSQMLELLRQLRHADRQQQARLAWNRLEFRRYRKCLYLLPLQQTWSADIAPRTLRKPEVDVPETGVRLRILKTVGRGLSAKDVDLSRIKIDGYRKNTKIKLAWNRKTKALSNLFQELGVPPWERCRIPVLSIDGVVIYVPTVGSTVNFCASVDEPSIQFLLEEI
jgi:tRNA(Ile)-lysidine synthase